MVGYAVVGVEDDPFESDENMDELTGYSFGHSKARKQKSGEKTKHAVAQAQNVSCGYHTSLLSALKEFELDFFNRARKNQISSLSDDLEPDSSSSESD